MGKGLEKIMERSRGIMFTVMLLFDLCNCYYNIKYADQIKFNNMLLDESRKHQEMYKSFYTE